MNRTARASAVSIALATGLVLAACGQDADDNAAEFEPDDAATQDEAPADDDTDTSDDDATGDDAAGDDTAGDDAADDDTTGDTSGAAGDIPAEYDGVLAAIDLAASEVGGPAFELDEDDGRWEIYVSLDGREVEVAVNREGTEILGQEPDDDGLDSDEQALLEAAGEVTMADALRLAIVEHGGTAEVEEIEVSSRDGLPVWSVEFRDSVDVYVDPAAQEVVHVDR
ncbi:hypothetical protein [Bogoriella caseilytica]|uniref:Peptidase YpeB-like protein n=1 Tax=Bogoriella caseilytica TaxID=56055 RepID=A0A3N2BFM5_9MICO|nr:hypothetical protein [Bogoriella caseilytica]ROR74020.1 hypothetical protein EDD31_2416 [Bogoriella caseilytica]